MTSNLAIVEIAGRDSIAAGVAAVGSLGFTQLLPTVAYTGTESGDTDSPYRGVEILRDLLGPWVEVHEPDSLWEPELWGAMNGHPAAEIQRRFGVYSPCLACHLYLHLVRVPLSWSYGNAPIVSGERDTHDGRIKLSQTAASIDAATRVLRYADIELLQPVRSLDSTGVAALVGTAWDESAEQLGCLLSGNYVQFDGTVTYNEAGYARYLEEFFEPVGRAVIDAWRLERAGGPEPDFDAIVREILSR